MKRAAQDLCISAPLWIPLYIVNVYLRNTVYLLLNSPLRDIFSPAGQGQWDQASYKPNFSHQNSVQRDLRDGHLFLTIFCMGTALTCTSLCTMFQKNMGTQEGGHKTTVILLLSSEILITLEVLSDLQLLCHHILRSVWGNDWHFTHLFSFFNLFPKEISSSMRSLAVYIILLFIFISE